MDKLEEPAIRNVSDTALWVAMYRALESERPDALFRDPYARALAGERGARIAAQQTEATKHAWSFTARTALFDPHRGADRRGYGYGHQSGGRSG